MILPLYVEYCIQALENAGFAAYAVGGCVRDALLGLTPQDYDLCTAAEPETVKAVFSGHDLVLAGEKHGTVGVILEGQVVEITTFRRESGYEDNRHPDRVEFVTSIEADLARRDFTVNAMAFSPTRGFADPFGGREDLKHGLLRAVGDPAERFREDSLRILRGARFAARFRLEVEEHTAGAMFALAPLMENLARERVFDELCKLLLAADGKDLRRFAPILAQTIPELAPTMGFDQHNPHHIYDVYTHAAQVTESVARCLPLRWAALLHDVGKPATFTLDAQGKGHFYGHAKVGAEMADAVLRRLKAPNALREEVVSLVELHMTKIEPEKKTVRRWLSRLGPERLERVLQLQEADMGGKGRECPEEMAQFEEIRRLMLEIQGENACFSLKELAVNGHDLMALGFSGPAIGQTLHRLLELVIDDRLPNEKAVLLAYIQSEL